MGRGDRLAAVVVVVLVVAPGPAMATDPIAAIFLSGFHLTTSP